MKQSERNYKGLLLALTLVLLLIISISNYWNVKKNQDIQNETNQSDDSTNNLLENTNYEENVEYEQLNNVNDTTKEQQKGVLNQLQNKITTDTILTFQIEQTNMNDIIINEIMNSDCLEMGFTEFRQFIKEHQTDLLTEQVYHYMPESMLQDLDHLVVNILRFDTKQVILGISCGQASTKEVKSCFEYFAIVDDHMMKVFSLSDLDEYTTIYFECKVEDYDFPLEILDSLKNGMYFEEEQQLYNFLESYSS